MMGTRNLLAIDVETSGANLFTHQLLSLAIVPFDDKLPILSIFIKPERIVWNKFGLRCFQNYKDEWMKESVSPYEAILRVKDYFERLLPPRDYHLVGHNVGFDYHFLKKLNQIEEEKIQNLSYRTIDTHSLLYALFLKGKIPKSALKSEGAFQFFDVKIDTQKRHTALGDAIAAKELFEKIVSFK